MKCHQCSNVAMFQVGPQNIPLCLSCNALMQQMIERNVQMLREEQNHAMDSIDAMFGIRTGARYPTKRPVVVSGGTVNHIAISNSQVGILNTGNINNLNQTIDTLYAWAHKDLADNIKSFSQAIIADKKLTDDQKEEVLESLDVITKELFQKPEVRKKAVAKTLMTQIAAVAAVTADALSIWQILHPLLQKFF